MTFRASGIFKAKPSPRERRLVMAGDSMKAHEEEYKRWQGYANALLLALTVPFASTAIAFPKKVAPVPIISSVFIISGVLGLAGILLTVCWFALESKQKIRNKPAFLWLASCAFGCQVGVLFVALLLSVS